MKIFSDRSRSGLRAVVLAFAALIATGCSDHPLDSRAPDTTPTHNYTLPAIEATACKHGGEYPYCRPPSNPDGMDPGSEPPPPDAASEPCDPVQDPTCEQPLKPEDRTLLVNVLKKYRRPDSAFTDPGKRAQCAEMQDRFALLLDGSKVFRGSTTTVVGDPGIDPHTAAYDEATGHIHFDPEYLTRAAAGDPYWERDLANSALHETAHALGHQHGDLMPSPWGPVYPDPYFNLLSPGTNSCLQWG